jgi:hypothetical protein
MRAFEDACSTKSLVFLKSNIVTNVSFLDKSFLQKDFEL